MDEGISIGLGVPGQNVLMNPMAFQGIPQMMMGQMDNAVLQVPLPPHIQLQQAQEAYLLQQQQQQQLDLELEPDNRQFVPQEDSNSANVPEDNNVPEENPAFQLDQAGDANNNDQPEDANNNTTDPALQQLQQQQILLQQQQNNQQQNIANENTQSQRSNSESITENGINNQDKKDKRKKKKKKKKNRLVTVIGSDGTFKKELPDTVNGEQKVGETNGVEGDENDEPSKVKVEVE